jgi:hypothetical protein
MSIFSTILDKLGIHKPAAPATPAAPAPAKPASTATPYTPGQMGVYGGPPAATPATPVTPSKPSSSAAPYIPGGMYPPAAAAQTPAKPAEMPMVDVTSHLDNLAKASSIPLNWRMSINDLKALWGMAHSPDASTELAVELGCPEKEMADSYSRNVWTHTALLKKIAENGGNIPQELLK